MKNISVLIKPASGACNMTCDYCFYCDEAAKREQKFYGMMSEETLKNMIRRTMLHSEGNAFEMGMNDHIAKSIDVEKVEEVLVALLKE